MARPRLDQPDRRSAHLRVRLTPAELARLQTAALASGIPFSDFVRERVLTGRVVVREAAELSPPVWLELRRIGVNLNQIARAMNAASLDPKGTAVVEAKAAEVVALLTRPADQLPDGDGFESDARPR